MSGIILLNWTPRISGTLRGFVSVRLPSGLVLHEITVHHRDGSWWVAFPAKPMLDRDGAVLREASGRIRYSAPLLGFADRAVRDRFTAQVMNALGAAHPELFTAEALA